MRLALVALALAGAAALPAAATPLAPSHEFAAEPSASLDPAVEASLARRRGRRPSPPPTRRWALLPDARRLGLLRLEATTEGKLRVCYCDDGLPQWLKRKKNNNKGKVGDEKHKVQLRHGALQPEKVLWGDSRGARRRRD